jgi:hypothetical protein
MTATDSKHGPATLKVINGLSISGLIWELVAELGGIEKSISGGPDFDRNHNRRCEIQRTLTAATPTWVFGHAKSAEEKIDWLVSAESQKAIADYKINGEQLFYPNANDPGA